MSWFTDDNLRIKARVYENEAEGTMGHSLAMAAHELLALREFLARLHAIYTDGNPFANRIHIIAAACRTSDLEVHTRPPPARHNDIMATLSRADQRLDRTEQGFITNNGVFVGRPAARVIAQQAGQIVRRVGGDDGALYTENLW